MIAERLQEFLARRFNVSPPTGLNPIQVTEWSKRTKAVIQLRVINVLRQWPEHFWLELRSPGTEMLLHQIQSFVRTAIPIVEGRAQQLLAIIERRLRGETPCKTTQPSIRNSPRPILPRSVDKIDFLKVDPVEVAGQLESHVFSKVQVNELLNKAWQKKKGENVVELAPNVRALIRYSNQLSNWVGGLILHHSDLKRRTQVINQLIHVAHSCNELRNYSAVISIISGLDNAPIYRLDRTCNFGVYRNMLRVAVPPCIPFLGGFFSPSQLPISWEVSMLMGWTDLYLKDLTFIEDGNPCVTGDGLINFHKYTMLTSTIHEIQRFKEAPYALQPVSALEEYLFSQLQSACDLHDLWEKSRRLEPRGRGCENAHRLSYTSTGSHMSAMVIASLAIDE
ncbi:Guanine-nucleotide dissociation stimulator CDC25 [Penicillium capsulatum]|nr:Guanine-nucleotide dissociation stimulator CDC25 [Penicillium capsulatum]